MPNYRQTYGEAQRKQMLADQLAQQATIPVQRQQGRQVAATGFADGLTMLGQALASRRAGKQAAELGATGDEERRKAQVEALGGLSRPPNMVELPERQNPYARAQSALEADVDPNVVGSYLKAQDPTAGADSSSLAGYRQAKAEGYGGSYTDYKKEFEGREANVPADIQKWREWLKLKTPDERAQFLEVLRAVPIETINQVPTRVPGGGAPIQPLSTLPAEADAARTVKDAEAEGAQTGAATGTAVANLPVIQSSTRMALETVDKMLKHPGMATATGLSGTLDPRNYIPGTEARDFQTLRNQAQGQVFLDAYQSLKGGGVITEIEGLKAEQAKARMDTAQSDEEFRSALNEYANALRRGLQLAEQRAGMTTGGGFGTPPAATPATPPIAAPAAPGVVNWADLQ